MSRKTLLTVLMAVVAVSGCTGTESVLGGEDANYRHTIELPEGFNSGVEEVMKQAMDSNNVSWVKMMPLEDNGTRYVNVFTELNETDKVREAIQPEGGFRAAANILIRDGKNMRLEENHTVEIDGETVTVSGTELDKNSSAEVQDTELSLNGFNEYEGDRYANISATLYKKEDIESVRDTSLRPAGTSGVRYRIPLQLNRETADKVHDVMQNYRIGDPGYGGERLENSLGEPVFMNIYFDGEKINSLLVSTAFRERAITQNYVTGSKETETQAEQEAEEIKQTLQSAQLPEGLELVNTEKLNSTED